MDKIIKRQRNALRIGLVGGTMIAVVMLLGLPSLTQAATYGYVSTNGYVRSVVANGWQEAINTASSQISYNSGVILLQTAKDFDMVGNYVTGVNNN